MSKFPVVLRVAPVRETGLFGAHTHQARIKPPANADPSRLRLNEVLHGSGDVRQDVLDIFSQHKLADKRGVPFAEMVLTANAAWFDEICPGWKQGKRTPAFQQWLDLTMQFLREEYGEGLASAVLHMDEEAPHIHAMIVPICTYTKRFRHGQKEVTRIKYSHFFSDDAQLISKARKENNPELTKLGRLQSRYAAAVAPTGLVRGRRGSQATHTSTSEWRKQLNQPSQWPARPALQDVPEETALEKLTSKALGKATRKEQVSNANDAMRKAYQKEIKKYVRQAQSKAKRYDALASENKALKKELAAQERLIMSKDNELKKITEELSLYKAQIDALRKAPLETVAKLLHYTGEIYVGKAQVPKWKGAIDMVMEVAGLDYRQAVAWLYHELGESKATMVVKQQSLTDAERMVRHVVKQKDAKPLTKQEYAVQKELGKQLDALDAPQYRITMMHAEANKTYNFGKIKMPDGTVTEKLYSKDELLSLVPKLNNENWRREYNVFVTPVDDTHHYILLDDLTKQTLREIEQLDVKPCVVQQSSPGSLQAVVKVEADKVDRKAASEWFKEMNRQYGDAKISGLIHPFRAAGFRNMKPKHLDAKTQRRPIVKLLATPGGVCRKAVELIRAFAATLAQPPEARPWANRESAVREIAEALEPIEIAPSVDDGTAAFYEKVKLRFSRDFDASRADWMLAQHLLKLGHEPKVVKECIRRHSPDLATRKAPRRIDYYLNLTVTKALNEHQRLSGEISESRQARPDAPKP